MATKRKNFATWRVAKGCNYTLFSTSSPFKDHFWSPLPYKAVVPRVINNANELT